MTLNFYGESNYLLVQNRCICCFIFIYDGDHQSNKLCPEIQILCCWSLFFFRNFLFLTLLKQGWIYFILQKLEKLLWDFHLQIITWLEILNDILRIFRNFGQRLSIQFRVDSMTDCMWLWKYIKKHTHSPKTARSAKKINRDLIFSACPHCN